MKQQIQINQIEWKEVEIGELLDYEQPTNYIVKNTDYDKEYKIPVLTAGKSFILGYTNETEGIYDKLPVIIFDDFTTDIKFVDFKFKVKSSAMKLLRPKEDKSDNIDLKFIFFMMKGLKIDYSKHKRYYLSVYQRRKILMPFKDGKPNIETQKRIVSILEKAEKQIKKCEKAERLLDEYLKSVFYEMFEYKNKIDKVKIKEVVQKISKENLPKDYPEEYFEYVDISSIDNKIGMIIDYKKIIGKKAPSRAKQKIEYNDLIVSTVRPNLNSVALVPKELDQQICSTGFCVLRVDKKKILPEFLYQITRSSKFIKSMMKIAKGASYPAVSDRDIKNYEIPIPPLPPQQKFSKIVEQVEKMKQHIKKTKQNSQELFDSLMSKAFRGEL